MVRVAILGATGYTALELIKILLRHPEVEITTLTSRSEGNPHVASIHPQLAGRIDLRHGRSGPSGRRRPGRLRLLLPAAWSGSDRLCPSCWPPERGWSISAPTIACERPQSYEQWYGEKHADPERLGKVVYGLPELFREQIRPASLVANPGCYPTSAILALAPFLKHGLIDPQTIIVDSKSGVSGAGRTPKLTTHFPECNESISAYNVGRHRHTPEIEEVLSHRHRRDVERDLHPAPGADGPRNPVDDLFAAEPAS